MGGGASSLSAETQEALKGLPESAQKELTELAAKMSTDVPLNILLQEDLTIRGGAQLWLMNCGSRLQAAGHNVTFLLPSESQIIEDCEKISGAKVEKLSLIHI